MAQEANVQAPVALLGYVDAMLKGGMCCWWCAETCPPCAFVAPRVYGQPFKPMGFFCSAACAKAFMLNNNIPVHNLKKMLKHFYGTALSQRLPCAPAWQCLAKFGPPRGTMTVQQFRTHTDFDDVSLQAPHKDSFGQCFVPPARRNRLPRRGFRRKRSFAPPAGPNAQVGVGKLRRNSKRIKTSILQYLCKK